MSVIIPVYNTSDYIAECLDSVVNQTLSDIEIICVDDHSTDRSVDVIRDYQKKYGNIALLQTEVNSGAGVARNLGIEYATGEFLAFIDPDDYYADDCVLEKLYSAAVQNEADLCGANIRYLTKGNLYLPKRVLEYEIIDSGYKYSSDYLNVYMHQRTLFRRSFIEKYSLHYPAYRRGEDPLFMIRCLHCAKRIYLVPMVAYIYRVKYNGEHVKTDFQVEEIMRSIIETMNLAIEYGYNSLLERFVKEFRNFSLKSYAGRFEDEVFWNYITEAKRIIDEAGFIFKDPKDKIMTKTEFGQYLLEVKITIFELKASNKKLAIYGAGVVGKRIKVILNKFGIGNVCFFVSESDDSVPDNVIAIDDVKNINQYSIVLGVHDDHDGKDIMNTLQQKGYSGKVVTDFLDITRVLDGVRLL